MTSAGLPQSFARPETQERTPPSLLILLPLVLIALVGLWSVVIRLADTPPYVLPSPTSVLLAFGEHQDLILRHLRITIVEVFLGVGLGVFAGVLVALAMATSRTVRHLVYPLLLAFEGVPKIALAPIIVVWLGTGLVSKVALAALLPFFPVVVQLTRGLRAIDEHVYLFMHSLQPSRWRLFWKVRLPAATPSLLDALRLAVPLAMIGAIVGEFISSSGGLGFLILFAIGNLDMALAFAVLIVIAVISGLVHPAVTMLEHLYLRWLPPAQR
jgi:NitT/TauT family transport system permease protein